LGDVLKRAVLAVGRTQDIVVGLVLPIGGMKMRAQVLTEEYHCGSLIGRSFIQAKPEHMHVIGHHYISRASEVIATAGMQEDEPPIAVEIRREPPSGAIGDSEGLMNKRAAAIVFRRKARQMALD